MRDYQILPHIADIRLLLMGDSLIELFTAGLEAIADLLKPGGCQNFQSQVSQTIELKAPNVTVLLIDFLSEVVSLSYADKVLYCKVNFNQLSETSLSAIISGVSVETFEEDIKAVTYHEANVVKNKQGVYETKIVLDI